ncbi:hypothetical protein K456DRAFT_54677 [Colletotrichum gloeosporioides 23]|nr:hypothetical protein K456DRAFT_54677 [Colletotrichum gloeosporioides 23]
MPPPNPPPFTSTSTSPPKDPGLRSPSSPVPEPRKRPKPTLVRCPYHATLWSEFVLNSVHGLTFRPVKPQNMIS